MHAKMDQQPIFACQLSQKYESTNENISIPVDNFEPNMKTIPNGHSYDDNNNNVIEQNGGHDKCFEPVTGKPLVVFLKNVSFSYNRKEKLIDNLNVNITGGQIYGLLGPSGCGKSTTLKLILGLLRPRKGQVVVYGSKPNTLLCPIPGPGAGYMPQELALMPTMTVADHFNYYGSLNEMKPREIGKRSTYLMELLQIPSMERPVEKLSGGQQRRTSLALTLLHSPPLLILDEPTVGVDPVLRNKIWLYLQELTVKENKTVILTTHYIEEARSANTIALMRYGRLLAEANPDRLLSAFNMPTIEEVFLNLCEKEDSDDMFDKAQQQTGTNKKSKKKQAKKAKANQHANNNFELMPTFAKYHGRWANNAFFNWLRVWAIICDAFVFMNGKFWTILIACLLPTLQVFLFHFSIGKPISTYPISVITPENRSVRFSDVLIEQLESKNVHVERHRNVSDAVDSVKNGFSFASFEFKGNFTKCLINRIRKGYDVSDYDIDCSRVRMSSDNTYQFIIFQMALDLRDAFLEAIYRFFPSLGYNPEALNVAVKVEEYVYGSEKFSYQEFMTPGMYMALIYLAPLIVTLFVLLEQKVYGHVERSRASGARPLEILAAHFLGNSLILVLQTGFMMGVSLNYFEAQNLGSILLLLGIVYLEGVAGICLAILMATVMDNKLAALVFIYGITISLWMICGVFWPIQNITFALFRKLVVYLPLTLPIETARNIMNRGWSWDHQDVLLGFASAGVYCAVPLLLAYLIFK